MPSYATYTPSGPKVPTLPAVLQYTPDTPTPPDAFLMPLMAQHSLHHLGHHQCPTLPARS